MHVKNGISFFHGGPSETILNPSTESDEKGYFKLLLEESFLKDIPPDTSYWAPGAKQDSQGFTLFVKPPSSKLQRLSDQADSLLIFKLNKDGFKLDLGAINIDNIHDSGVIFKITRAVPAEPNR